MKNLFILNGPTSNRGCEAILISTHKILTEAFPNSLFINSSVRDKRLNNLEYLKLEKLQHKSHPEMLSIDMINWQISKRLIGARFYHERFLHWADYVYSIGGDNYSLDYGNARNLFEANERVYTSGKKLIIWGASIGPFNANYEIEKIAKENLKKAYRIVVRESLTQQYLNELGVCKNVFLMPDPAFSLKSATIPLPDKVESMLSDGAIGLNLSPLLARYRNFPERWICDATSWIDGLLQATRLPIILIPHVMSQGNDDQKFMKQLINGITNDRSRVHLLDSYGLSAENIKYVISRLTAFIGARTHATIAALSTGVPTLSIGYSIKAHGINHDIFGHNDWVVDHKNLIKSKLTSKVIDLLASNVEIREFLAKRNIEYRINPENVRKMIAEE